MSRGEGRRGEEGSYELLGGEDGIHDGDVSSGEIGGDGENEDAGIRGRREPVDVCRE